MEPQSAKTRPSAVITPSPDTPAAAVADAGDDNQDDSGGKGDAVEGGKLNDGRISLL